MLDFLHEISNWILAFADSPWAIVALAIDAFTESIINPFPPDPLLIAIALRQPNIAFLLAGVATIASVLGALVGHWIGLKLGRPVVLRFISESKVMRVERMFQKYGAWAILIAAFTPIPYKVFAVTAGVLELNRRTFLIASVIGRGARFFLIAGLIFFAGNAIQEFIETRFELITIVFSVALIAALAIIFFLSRRKRSSSTISVQQPSEGD